MPIEKLGRIAFISDERLPREKEQIILRKIQSLKPYAHVDILSPELTESELLSRVKARSYHIVLAPWYRYLRWIRIDAHLGSSNGEDCTYAGYFGDQLEYFELEDRAPSHRGFLLDFDTLNTHEIHSLIRSLKTEENRSGLIPLVGSRPSIYYSNWYDQPKYQDDAEAILSLPQIEELHWVSRSNSIRLSLLAMSNIVYSSPSPTGPKEPRVTLQISANGTALFLRFCFSRPSIRPKDWISEFWPPSSLPSSSARLLLQHTDFIRINMLANCPDVEITLGLLQSAPSMKQTKNVHSLWIDVIRPGSVSELPNIPQKSERGKYFPLSNQKKEHATLAKKTEDSKNRILKDSQQKIISLTKKISEQSQVIRELKAGGVGSREKLAPPDPSSLLEAFQERYFNAQFQIRKIERQLFDFEENNESDTEIEKLNRKLNTLLLQEQEWINQITGILRRLKRRSS